MFKSGLLILTQPLQLTRGRIPVYLNEVNRLVGSTLYVCIQPSSKKHQADLSKFKVNRVPLTVDVHNFVKDFYVTSANVCSTLDIRILLGHITNLSAEVTTYDLTHLKDKCDVILLEEQHKPTVEKCDDSSLILKNLQQQFQTNPNTALHFLSSPPGQKEADVDSSSDVEEQSSELLTTYDHLVLGGTFDRLHSGHKVLLSEGLLLSDRSLTIGVTESSMNGKKTLCELIEPVESRIDIVDEFLKDVRPDPDYRRILVPITDGFGPTVTVPDLDCIVVSEETKKGGDMINDERAKRGMKPLVVYVIDLIEDQCHSQYEEDKVSSSSLRKRLLGTLVNPLKPGVIPARRPYVIGLTGGIASGKSAVCKRLEGLGAVSVDCDKLGHLAYVRGSPGFDKVVEAFGADIVGEDGEVNRRKLGPIVFSDKSQLKKLNEIVWPEIAGLAQAEIQKHAEAGKTVVVLEAALLLEAGWDSMVQEVWTTIVPPTEAVKRMVDRNNLTEEQANQRLQSQITNETRVQRSNVVLCTLWEYEYTQQQVEKAWRLLQQRISSPPEGASGNSSQSSL